MLELAKSHLSPTFLAVLQQANTTDLRPFLRHLATSFEYNKPLFWKMLERANAAGPPIPRTWLAAYSAVGKM